MFSSQWIMVRVALVGMPLTVASATRGSPYVTTDGGSLRICNRPFQFVGFNVRGICHYGHGDALPYSNTADIAANLDYCVQAGASVIRVFCAYKGIGPVETGDRLGVLLNACQARGLYVVVDLTDCYGGTNLHPQGDSQYYTVPGVGVIMLNNTWYQSAYTINYLPQALYLAGRFKDHPAVFAWQQGNELHNDASPATFVTFCQAVATQIRSVDPNHLIGAGIIGWRMATGNNLDLAIALYGSMDFVGTHNYNGSDTDNDAALADYLNKPYLVDETGFHSGDFGPDRTPETNSDIAKWLARGVDGYLQWGLMATAYDNGDGDRYFGVDPVFHGSDFVAYRDLFHSWASSLEPPPTLETAPTAFEHHVALGAVPPDDVFTVRNVGSGGFDFQVQESLPWLSVAPDSGHAGCDGVPVTIQYHTELLLPGNHSANLQVVAEGVAGSPQNVTVSVTVEGLPGDFDGDGDIDQTDFGQFQPCLSGEGIPQMDPACYLARLQGGDNDVDEGDLAGFLRCMTAPGIAGDPHCAD